MSPICHVPFFVTDPHVWVVAQEEMKHSKKISNQSSVLLHDI